MPRGKLLSDAEIRRKTNKPIMEKKRRQRINKCLEELKNIVLSSSDKKTRPNKPRSNKLEKADILEMTVRYLKSFKSETNSSPSESTSESHQTELTATKTQEHSPYDVLERERCEKHKGYNQCLQNVMLFMNSLEGNKDLQNQLYSHLSGKCKFVEPEKVRIERGLSRESFHSSETDFTAKKPLTGRTSSLDQNLFIQRNYDFSSHFPAAERSLVCTPPLPTSLSALYHPLYSSRQLNNFYQQLSFSKSTSKIRSNLICSDIQMDCNKQDVERPLEPQLDHQPIPQAPLFPTLSNLPSHQNRLNDSSDSGNGSSASRSSTPNEKSNARLSEDFARSKEIVSITNAEKTQNDNNAFVDHKEMWRPWQC